MALAAPLQPILIACRGDFKAVVRGRSSGGRFVPGFAGRVRGRVKKKAAEKDHPSAAFAGETATQILRRESNTPLSLGRRRYPDGPLPHRLGWTTRHGFSSTCRRNLPGFCRQWSHRTPAEPVLTQTAVATEIHVAAFPRETFVRIMRCGGRGLRATPRPLFGESRPATPAVIVPRILSYTLSSMT